MQWNLFIMSIYYLGVQTMAYAFMLSPGKEKDSALANVKQQFKECTELLCSYENSLEALMGTFRFEMKGCFSNWILVRIQNYLLIRTTHCCPHKG